MKKRRDHVDEAISQGAFVLPPPVPAPAVQGVPVVTPPATEEAMTPVEPYIRIERTPTVEPEPPGIGSVVDCVVIAWHDQCGLARPLDGRQEKGRRDGYYIHLAEVLTTGHIHIGTKLRGKITEPEKPDRDYVFQLKEIEVYQD